MIAVAITEINYMKPPYPLCHRRSKKNSKKKTVTDKCQFLFEVINR